MLNIVSFFSGAGGMDLGFILAGHNIVWSNDFDKDAVNTYNNNISKITNHKCILGDISEILNCTKEKIDEILPDCDMIIGGFPCQGFSIANISRSMQDERNYLYLELLKAISIKQPKYFILENVKGLENMDGGEVLNMILNDLEIAGTTQCKMYPNTSKGYTVVYNVLNALDYGVPQNRERVIILGVRNDIINEFKEEHLGIIGNKTNSSKANPRKLLNVQKTHSKQSELFYEHTPSMIINNLYYDICNISQLSYIKENTETSLQLYKHENLERSISDLPYNFTPNNEIIFNHTGSLCKVKISNRVGNRATDWKKYAPTIMGRGSGSGGPLIPPHPEQHRRFSIRETARIQTFPDNFIFHGSNSACYRQIGNAVPVLLAYNIAKIFS